MDYLTGVAELGAALSEGRAPRLSAELALHVTEIALAIHDARHKGTSVDLRTTVAFDIAART